MRVLRKILSRVSWPVDALSDEDIAFELYRRWFTNIADTDESEYIPSGATAYGIYESVATSGNLDALCWAENTNREFSNEATDEELEAFSVIPRRQGPHEEVTFLERRKSPRKEAGEYIDLVELVSTRRFSGWLIETSADGTAFVAQTRDVPSLGTRLAAIVKKQKGGSLESALVTVVRTECLSDSLSLVCAHCSADWGCKY